MALQPWLDGETISDELVSGLLSAGLVALIAGVTVTNT